ncbi:MAG TPA: hypothetical protein VL098_03325 [Flavipsychrobacter sp.]|nr:hypothetical protein [Flavipsychrobacter sp.]
MPAIKFNIVTLLLLVFLSFNSPSLYAQSCPIQGGAVAFKSGSELTTEIKNQLHSLAEDLRAFPDCRVVVQGNGSTTKGVQQLGWERATNIITFLNDTENISRDRLIIMIGGAGDDSEATYRAASDGETGPASIPPPYPQSRH